MTVLQFLDIAVPLASFVCLIMLIAKEGTSKFILGMLALHLMCAQALAFRASATNALLSARIEKLEAAR